MSFLDGFIGSSNVISCLCASFVRAISLNRFVWQGVQCMCCLGFVDPMQDHQENKLGEFKVQKPWGTIIDY